MRAPSHLRRRAVCIAQRQAPIGLRPGQAMALVLLRANHPSVSVVPSLPVLFTALRPGRGARRLASADRPDPETADVLGKPEAPARRVGSHLQPYGRLERIARQPGNF